MGFNNLLFIICATLVLVVGEVVGHQSNLVLPGCPVKCGNVTIPYPFGFKKGCYYSHPSDDVDYYKISCSRYHDRKHLSHRNRQRVPMYGNLEVLNIDSMEGNFLTTNFVSHACFSKNGTQIRENYPTLSLKRFTISTTENVFAAIGCDTYAWFEGERHGKNYTTGCMTVCDSPEDVTNGTCSGLGCCQTPIPDGLTNIRIEAMSFSNHTNVNYFNPCSSSFIVAKDAFKFSLANLTSRVPHKFQELPMVFDWMIGEEDCSTAIANGKCLCQGKSICDDSRIDAGYRCKCLPGYSGNPYLKDGCQDVDECNADVDINNCEKPEYCVNTIGSYYCQCPEGSNGNGTKTDHCIADKETFSTAFKVTAGVGGGIIASIVIAIWLYWQHEKKQVMKAREEFFKQNGGHLLHEKLSSRDVAVETIKIFTNEELEKATNKYSHSNIIGKGGFGIVYKGVLANNNNQEVAIKKSLKVDPQQSEQFINEIIVLSQLNNRNVVKLLGCCLETEVPLLVYEFIDNGTLYDHLHDKGKASLLTWDARVRIALEVAEVLSYLHTTISIPIIHRDIKSKNILLDKNYTAKVSDFGDSRLLPMDQDQLATVVLGTRGYLDPEYLQTSELTQKSDVYSFGVVVVELLTSENVLSYDRSESDRCLAMFFLRKLRENRLFEILDKKLTNDEGHSIKQMFEVANLAQRCLKLKGDERPTMKEVAMELQRIRGMMEVHPWSNHGNVPQEESAHLLGDIVRVDDDEYHNYGSNNMESSSNSQISSSLASLELGR